MTSLSELTGEVRTVSWRNPHIRMSLQVETPDGAEIWELEAGAINTVERLGVSTDDIRVGDRIRVAGYVSRQGQLSMFVANALVEGERELLMLPATSYRWSTDGPAQAVISEADAALANQEANGLFRVWTRLLSVAPFWDVSLTDAAQSERDEWDAATDDPRLRCEAPGMIEAMVTPSPIELIADGDDIVIRIEEWDQTRRIHMTDAEDVANVEPSALGYSVGLWEDDVLVVTTRAIDWPYFDDQGVPQSDDVAIVERFRMTPEETHMTWEATISDPEFLRRPAIVREEYIWVPGEQIKPYNCAL